MRLIAINLCTALIYIYIYIKFKLIESPNTSFKITNLCICLFIYLCNNDLVLHVHNEQNKKNNN